MQNEKRPACRQAGITNILIVLFGVIIAAVLIGLFTQRGFISKTADNLNTNTSQAKCGLVVTAPAKSQTVIFPLQVTGYVNGCGWSGFEGQVGAATLFDEAGNQLSDVTPMKVVGDWTQLPADFQFTLKLNAATSAKNLKIVFRNENPSGDPAKDKSFELKLSK